MDGSGAGNTPEVAFTTLHPSKTQSAIEVVRGTTKADPRTGSTSGRASATKTSSATTADPSGCGAGHGIGDRGVSGRSQPLYHAKQVASYIGMIPREYSSGQ